MTGESGPISGGWVFKELAGRDCIEEAGGTVN
jgi:hypothetical protein